MSAADSSWVDIGALDDIPVLGARVVNTSTGCIAVFRTTENAAFAIDDACPHKGGPLSQGIVHDRSVTCPLHNWVISLESGKAQDADSGEVRTHAVRIEAGRLLLDTSKLRVPRAA